MSKHYNLVKNLVDEICKISNSYPDGQNKINMIRCADHIKIYVEETYLLSYKDGVLFHSSWAIEDIRIKLLSFGVNVHYIPYLEKLLKIGGNT